MQFSIHKNFQLNGKHFGRKDFCHSALDAESKSKLKIDSPQLFSFLSDFLSDSETVNVQTSGSTGKPKLIEIKKEFMINSALATGEFFDLKENTTALLCMNPKFIAGKMMLVRAMVLGWQLDVVPPSSNPLNGVEKVYDFCAMVPMQVHHSLDELYKIKKLIIGGGAVSKELDTKLQTIKTEVFATYGMTETITHIAVKKLNNFQDVTLNGIERSFYETLPNITISKDNRGCLVIDAPKVSSNIVVTNDLVELISDTQFQWLGRFDNIINSGGIKLIPEQIEEKLAEIISERFFVTGIKDAVLGEKLILIVEKGSKELKVRNVISTSLYDQKSVILNEVKNLKSLTKYEMPKEIYFVEKFVETDTKKIQRKMTLDLIEF
ncbi:MAG: O-succinylbenzoic acid--CoA ligase [Lutibacter sp.]|nr:MAG: O-succinylbenzoic acid--CoA ligase [Lutibacter sp.]